MQIPSAFRPRAEVLHRAEQLRQRRAWLRRQDSENDDRRDEAPVHRWLQRTYKLPSAKLKFERRIDAYEVAKTCKNEAHLPICRGELRGLGQVVLPALRLRRGQLFGSHARDQVVVALLGTAFVSARLSAGDNAIRL